MRIIGGQASGMRLKAPDGMTTRPTGDRVREAIFNIIAQVVPGARVLDLYAGTGALGLEALSRGAQSCVFVEPDRQARLVIEYNRQHTKFDEASDVLAMKAETAVEVFQQHARRFDIIFLDPPWKLGVSSQVSDALHTIVPSNGLLICEHPTEEPSPDFFAFQCVRDKHYGDTAVSFYQKAGVH